MPDNSTFRVSGAFRSGTAKIGDLAFGANFLFDRDRTGVDGTFDEKAASLELSLLRYPGGAIAEESFNINAPDRRSNPALGNDLLPLSDFVSYASDNGYDYALVLPTKKYMDKLSEGRSAIDAMLDEYERFFDRLLAGEFGEKLPKVIEIGNEYYTLDGYTPTEQAQLYGTVARYIAAVAHWKLGQKVDVAVQAGINAAANDIILDNFRFSGSQVDQVIYHSYPWRLDESWSHQRSKTKLAAEWLEAGIAEGVFVSEFNISNQHKYRDGRVIGANDQEMGLAKAVALADMSLNMLAGGIDYGSVWPLQQNTNGDLGGDEGEAGSDRGKLSEAGLTLSGEAYRLISTSLAGKAHERSFRFDIDGADESRRYAKEVLAHSFNNAEETVVFILAWDLKPNQIGHEIAIPLDSLYLKAEVTRLSVEGDDYTNPNGRPELSVDVTAPTAGLTRLSVDLRDSYELIRIVLTKAPRQIEGGDEDDRIVGTDIADFLSGESGDDAINGRGGADTLLGGEGLDRLIGGDGKDRIFGQKEKDQLFGAAGADRLKGGGGDDLIEGGFGNDVSSGGQGQDSLTGDEGRDRLFGNQGADLLDGGDHADLLAPGPGNDTVFGGDGEDFITSVLGNETLAGGGGGDTFHFDIGSTTRRIEVRDFSKADDRLLMEGDVSADSIEFISKADRTVILVNDTRIVLLGDTLGDFGLSDMAIVPEGRARRATDGTLKPGITNTAIFGNKYEGQTTPDGYALVDFEGTDRDLTLSLSSFDIDVLNEVEVLLNGRHLTYLEKVGNNQIGEHTIQIAADAQINGANYISFVPAHPTNLTWGVQDLLIE